MAPGVGSRIFGDGRQRDLLPLPHLADSGSWTTLSHLGRGTRQRVSRRQATQARCNLACDALSAISCGSNFKLPAGPITEAQRNAHQVVQEAVEQCPRPRSVVLLGEALRLLLHSGGKYDGVDAAGALAPYGSCELSLPSDASSAPSLVSMLDAEDSQMFVGFREHLLLPEPEYHNLLQQQGPAGFYFDPILKHQRRRYLAFLDKMHTRGLLYWKRSVEESVGLFCVTKKSGAFRLIADARRANARFRTPKEISMPTAEGCSRFELGESGEFYGSGLDLKDYFHTLRISEDLASCFGLPPIRGSELPAGARPGLDFRDNDLVYPALATLPMGFAWARYAAQRVHEKLVTDAGMPVARRLHDRCLPLNLDEGDAHMVYVDNFCAISSTLESAVRARDAVWDLALEKGLYVHETFEGGDFEFLGLRFRGDAGYSLPRRGTGACIRRFEGCFVLGRSRRRPCRSWLAWRAGTCSYVGRFCPSSLRCTLLRREAAARRGRSGPA